MPSELLDPFSWSERHFGKAELGDARRTRRLVKLGIAFFSDPSMSLPEAAKTRGQSKAGYRFLDCDEVDFDNICSAHWQLTKELTKECREVLVVSDATELEFGLKRDVEGMPSLYKGYGHGQRLQTLLAVDSESGLPIGILKQDLHNAFKKKTGECRRELTRRSKATDVWWKTVEWVGRAPEGVRYVNVGDREGEFYELYARLKALDWSWVFRCAKENRKVFVNDRQVELAEYLSGLAGEEAFSQQTRWAHSRSTKHVRRGKERFRMAKLRICWAKVTMDKPKMHSDYVASMENGEIVQNVVRLWEPNPPEGEKPVDWILLTDLTVENLKDALAIVRRYGLRWTVEEYHKALKTGCGVEARYMRTASRLRPMIGILGIHAMRLLQLKYLAIMDPDGSAEEVFGAEMVKLMDLLLNHEKPMINIKRELKKEDPTTIRGFMRCLGQLGGHLGRKSDGNPGWQTLWKGLTTFLNACQGWNASKIYQIPHSNPYLNQ